MKNQVHNQISVVYSKQMMHLQLSKPAHLPGPIISSADQAHDAFLQNIDPNSLSIQRQILALFLNQDQQLVGFRCISTGNQRTVTPDLGLIIACAALTRCSSVIVATNYTTQSLTKSESFLGFTHNLKQALQFMDVDLVNSMVITKNSHLSK